MNLFIKYQCLQDYRIITHLIHIVHKTATYLSFLVRPFRWRGLCPLKILLARHHFSRKKKKQQKPPKTMLSNMRTSPNSLPPVIAFHSIQSVHLSAFLQVTLLVHMCPSLQRFSPSFIFSLSLNKRAVVVRSIWCTADSFRQLMHWSSLHLLCSPAGQCGAVFSSQYPYF